ncbi:phosphate ABC transporter permease subunit PstC [Bacillus horti]|uniref:phosphate ABC transporter permease subunit PstC n=1 Tax=Caldalkalibacillus horti TaxID=77523 RepID=UPI00351FA874
MSTNQDLNYFPIKQRFKEGFGKYATLVCAAILLVLILSITIFISYRGISTFLVNGVSLGQFFTTTTWSGYTNPPSFGALGFITSSFYVTILAAIISAPLGIGAAVFMTEIAPKFGQRILQPVIELLVGIPSVVYGFIGLTLLVPFIRNNFPGTGFSILAGSIVLSVMILPTITSLSADALRALPRELREASYALGATRFQTIYKILLKTALPGLLTAVILGMARAFGEALAVQMVIGNVTSIPSSLFDPAGTLTSIITLNMGNTVFGSVENNALWSLGLILLFMTYFFIILIRFLGKRRQYS